VFEFGLARREGTTSAALKYLCCFGLSSPTLAKDGVSFEETLILHLQRLYQCKGKTVKVVTFKHAWPGSANAKDGELTSEAIAKKMVGLDNYMQDEADSIKKQISASTSCVIFRQSDPIAQGADVLLAVQESRTSWAFDAIQCKNRNRLPSGAAKSIGIDKTSSTVWSCIPRTGSAGYSMAALLKVRMLMQASLPGAKKVTLRHRVLASTLRAAEFVKKDKNVQFSTCPALKLWCRT
ncbi:Hypothetical protein SCF082_LOCUS8900, partial [Durusdinium trenchii]